MLPDHEDSKVNACVENIFRFWQENNDKILTQLVFCDLSTPKGDGNFNVYDSDEPPKRGKDMNDYLKISLGLQRPQEIERL